MGHQTDERPSREALEKLVPAGITGTFREKALDAATVATSMLHMSMQDVTDRVAEIAQEHGIDPASPKAWLSFYRECNEKLATDKSLNKLAHSYPAQRLGIGKREDRRYAQEVKNRLPKFQKGLKKKVYKNGKVRWVKTKTPSQMPTIKPGVMGVAYEAFMRGVDAKKLLNSEAGHHMDSGTGRNGVYSLETLQRQADRGVDDAPDRLEALQRASDSMQPKASKRDVMGIIKDERDGKVADDIPRISTAFAARDAIQSASRYQESAEQNPEFGAKDDQREPTEDYAFAMKTNHLPADVVEDALNGAQSWHARRETAAQAVESLHRKAAQYLQKDKQYLSFRLLMENGHLLSQDHKGRGKGAEAKALAKFDGHEEPEEDRLASLLKTNLLYADDDTARGALPDIYRAIRKIHGLPDPKNGLTVKAQQRMEKKTERLVAEYQWDELTKKGEDPEKALDNGPEKDPDKGSGKTTGKGKGQQDFDFGLE